ncbi:hypothetical protein Tsubulata_012970 [Turnera subulata]|uniref:Hyccin n=1 Tax=Turnera subulata TaxID=218843 RepID=A0A9Q0FQ78_9ROSI|nr:hypothetical protein Tsubulata_012970 [Turnera subulata]
MSEDNSPVASPTARDDGETITAESQAKIRTAMESLSSILTPPTLPPSLLSSPNPAASLLHHHRDISCQISALLRQPESGAGDNNLCRWLYDTFQSSQPDLQLVVLRFLPTIAGLYLSRVALRKPLAGFEAVLLALYAHETTSRSGQAVTVSVPDLSHPSVYHEAKDPNPTKNNATDLNLAVISPSLEPHGTVRSTRRARIVGVALELYYSKISVMPLESKLEFCGFCRGWSGQHGDFIMYLQDSTTTATNSINNNEKQEDINSNINNDKEGSRIPLPWELLQPVLRILGNCLLGPKQDKQLFDAASAACRCLYARSLHDMDPKAILATGSLLTLSKMALDPKNRIDYTEITMSNVISI